MVVYSVPPVKNPKEGKECIDLNEYEKPFGFIIA